MKMESESDLERDLPALPRLQLVQPETQARVLTQPSAGDPFMVSSPTRARIADAVWVRVWGLIEAVLEGRIFAAVNEFYASDVELGRGALAPMFGLETRAGREYLVRVPGSATSALTDRQLAEVLNWIIIEFAGDSADPDFAPYNADEVRALRKTPLNEVEYYRVQVLTEIATNRVKQAE